MKKMAIILWHVSGKGGTETVVKTVIKELIHNKAGYTPQVFILGGTNSNQWLQGIKYSASPFIKNKMLRVIPYFFWLFRYVVKEKPDLIIGMSPMICLFLNIIRRVIVGKFVIISWIHFSLNANHMKKKWLKKADHHLAISTGISRQLEALGIPKENIHTIFNPVIKVDETIQRPDGEKVFIYVGRLTFEGQKRIKDLLHALSNIDKAWHLNIIGDGEDSEACKNYAQQLNIQDKITWYGWQSEPWLIIKEATALVLTSAYEGFPMVLNEAISRGVYCISSNCEVGPSDIIKQNLNGELYEVGDLESLQQSLQSIVDGKVLPDQEKMKLTLSPFYIENYFSTFIKTLDCICKV